MKQKPIIANRITIGVGAYPATIQEDQTVKHALVTFGYLIQVTGAITRYSFEEFANVIEANHSTEDPRTSEVVKTLRTIHQRMAEADAAPELVPESV